MNEQDRLDSVQKNGGSIIQRFGEKNLTYSLCLAAVKDDGTALAFVPEKLRTQEIYRAACVNNGLAIKYVPKQERNFDLYMMAACQTPEAIRFVPEKELTTDFCIAVFQKHRANAVRFIPIDMKNEAFFSAAIEKDPTLIWEIPGKYRTKKLCLETIRRMGYQTTAEAVSAVPELLSQFHTSMYDHDTCLAFVSSGFFRKTFASHNNWLPFMQGKLNYGGNSVSLVHLLRWVDVCELALGVSGLLLCAIKEPMITERMCEIAVSNKGNAFHFVPKCYRSRHLIEMAVDTYPDALSESPKQQLTLPICLTAVKQKGSLLFYVPDEFRTREVCLAAVANHDRALFAVPIDVMDKEIYLTALSTKTYGVQSIGNSSTLNYVSESMRDYEVCCAAINQSTANAEFIPESIFTEELCEKAVSGSFDTIKFIPKKFKTYDLCIKAVSHNWKNVEYVPGEFLTEEMYIRCFDSYMYCCRIDIVPKERLTDNVCIAYLTARFRNDPRMGGMALGDIPFENRTKTVCDFAMRNEPAWALQFVPEDLVTEEHLMLCAKETPGRLIDNFPARFRTDEFYQRLRETYPEHNWDWYLCEIEGRDRAVH
jgi:hypothetical protein